MISVKSNSGSTKSRSKLLASPIFLITFWAGSRLAPLPPDAVALVTSVSGEGLPPVAHFFTRSRNPITSPHFWVIVIRAVPTRRVKSHDTYGSTFPSTSPSRRVSHHHSAHPRQPGCYLLAAFNRTQHVQDFMSAVCTARSNGSRQRLANKEDSRWYGCFIEETYLQ
ncbi:hypothetical protein D3C86_1160340 [compost metagenome]